MVDVVRDAPRAPLPPIDTNVKLPKSVIDAGAKAEAIYQAAYPQTEQVPPEIAQEQPVAPQEPPAQEAPVDTQEAAPAPAQEQITPQEQPLVAQEQPFVQEQPAPQQTSPADQDDENVPPEQWRHRYLSMRGRVEQQRNIIAGMQDQMAQMGDELMRLQQHVERPPTAEQIEKYITPEDEQNYGSELIDFARRAAQDAVAPKLQGLERENEELRQQVIQDKRRSMFTELDREVPEWRGVNQAPAFKRWLSLRDIYSGSVRNKLLNDAYRTADAPRVVSFFKGFLRDAAIASGQQSAPQLADQPQPPNPAPQPRQPAIPLATLAAPGRPRPASGTDMLSVQQPQTPSFTRAQIASFYNDVRRGVYYGRENEKAELERQIFAAQNAGRVT
jgi:hypothetical protein